MTKLIQIAVLVTCTIVWVAAQAAVPSSVNYQAYLTDDGGTAIDGSTSITFAIYNVPTGGVPLWSSAGTIPVDQGLFSVELGGPGAPFPVGLFDTALWIGISVAGDPEMTPRRALTTAAFAFKSDDTLSLQGQGPGAFDQAAHVVDMTNPHGVDAAQVSAASSADIANLQAQLDATLASITSLQNDLTTANATIATLQTDLTSETTARIAAVDAEAASRSAADAIHDTTIASIQSNSVLALDGVLSLSGGDTALFDGVNVQVINGTGATDGNPNGRGNVIVGYNEVDSGTFFCSLGAFDNQIDCEANSGAWAESHKGGSHNVVIGPYHNYSRFGGLTVGWNNNITGAWSSVTGGIRNAATGNGATVSGGENNTASGSSTSVSGGEVNTASSRAASVSGGRFNTASGVYSSVSGGGGPVANDGNDALANYSSIAGGQSNITVAGADYSTVAGGLDNNATGTYSHVSGGEVNTASGRAASVSGGRFNTASGVYSSVSGGGGPVANDGNDALANYSSIAGGQSNITVAGADYSSVAGGLDNNATGTYSHVSGGRANLAWGNFTSITGGNTNVAGNIALATSDATNRYSVVVGGQFNATKGQYSVVSGGQNREVTGIHDWRAGGLFETN